MFEAFVATARNEIFSGDQSCECDSIISLFQGCPHHKEVAICYMYTHRVWPWNFVASDDILCAHEYRMGLQTPLYQFLKMETEMVSEILDTAPL
jgi:hypothetical protein